MPTPALARPPPTRQSRQKRAFELPIRAFIDAVLVPPKLIESGDRDQILGVLDGRCTVAIVNHYYLARMLESGTDEQRVALVDTHFGFADAGQGRIGNVSGIALTRRGRGREGATQLADWLTTPFALEEHVRILAEFPAGWPNAELQLPEALQPMAALRMAAPLPWVLYGDVAEARRLMDERMDVE